MALFARVGLIVKRDAPAAGAVLATLLDTLDALRVPVVTDRRTQAFFGLERTAVPRQAFHDHCDLVIVLGGDGTLLQAGRDLVSQQLPLLGVNLGRLGFMVDIAPEQIRTVLPRVLAGHCQRDRRALLEVDDGSGHLQLAINEVVVRHSEPVAMLEFTTHADSEFISLHRADGLIVCTPTGSTAYALSAGGPMLHPATHTIALVPICPHTLSDRPLILPAATTIRVSVAARNDGHALFICDGGQTLPLTPGTSLVIRPSAHVLELIHPEGTDHFTILRNKLNWGRDAVAGRS